MKLLTHFIRELVLSILNISLPGMTPTGDDGSYCGLSLLRKYVEYMQKVLPMKLVAKFFQVETQMLRLMDLQINTELPSLK